jgi:nucleoside recognition membrane protein YjiH
MALYTGVLESKSRTQLPTGVTTSNVIRVTDKYENAHIVLDITAGTGFTIQATVKGKDPVSGKTYSILPTPTINATGTTVMRIGPDFVTASGAGFVTAKDVLPYNWVVEVLASGTATYSIGASLI